MASSDCSSPSTFEDTSKIIGRFEKVRLLGSGTFGKAWLVRSLQSRQNYVIKEMKVTNVGKDKTKNEVEILKRCFHFNIIRYKEFFYGYNNDPEADTVLYMVMEYADGGDLHQYISHRRTVEKAFIDEVQIRNWFVQIALALNYLHKEMILHRDLKTHNIFVTSNKILKLGDFGISRKLSHENEFATTGIGTPQYLSPEMCQSQPYNYKSDIWSLGCVLYEMCALEAAFSGNDLGLLVSKIIKGAYKPLPGHYSDALKDLVKVLLRPVPERRPSAEQLLASSMFLSEVKAYMNYALKFQNIAKQKLEQERKDSSSSINSVDGGGNVTTYNKT